MINCWRAKCDGANSFFFDRKNKQPRQEEEEEAGHGTGHVAVINSSEIIVDHDDKEGEGGRGKTTTKVARKHDKTNPTQIDFLLESPSPCARTLATLLTAASSFPLAYPHLLFLLLLLLLANDFTVQWSSCCCCSSCCLLLHASLVIDGAKRSSASRSTLSRLWLSLLLFPW